MVSERVLPRDRKAFQRIELRVLLEDRLDNLANLSCGTGGLQTGRMCADFPAEEGPLTAL